MSARFLRREGLRVRLVTSPERALAELTGGPDAAAVVDLTMPGLDPRRIRRALRTPVIFLVADLKAPRPRGLAARGDATGARRWLARPFSPRQLVAMVREVLAQTTPARARPARTVPAAGEPAGTTRRALVMPVERSAGELRLDGTSRAAIADGHRVPLTATEYALLAFMMDHPGLVLSRQQLLAAAGRQGAGDRAADVHIAKLRAKIGADPRTGMIRTVRGTGYVLDP
jgi:two-component system, OmpR family, response regulator MtrA